MWQKLEAWYESPIAYNIRLLSVVGAWLLVLVALLFGEYAALPKALITVAITTAVYKYRKKRKEDSDVTTK